MLFSISLEVKEQEYFSYDPCKADSEPVVEPSSSEEEVIISYLGELSDFIRLPLDDLLSFLFSFEIYSIEKDWLLSSQIGVLPLFLYSRKMYFGFICILLLSTVHVCTIERDKKQYPIRETRRDKSLTISLTHAFSNNSDIAAILKKFQVPLSSPNRFC